MMLVKDRLWYTHSEVGTHEHLAADIYLFASSRIRRRSLGHCLEYIPTQGSFIEVERDESEQKAFPIVFWHV